MQDDFCELAFRILGGAAWLWTDLWTAPYRNLFDGGAMQDGTDYGA